MTVFLFSELDDSSRTLPEKIRREGEGCGLPFPSLFRTYDTEPD